MVRVHIICEGQTEETFVKELLTEKFALSGIYLTPSLIGKPGHKGGNVKYDRLFKDIRLHLLNDKTAFCTTFFDYYGLSPDFPGKAEADKQHNIADKARIIQDALVEKLTERIDENAMHRFIPYVQMYEFEALLFSDCAQFAAGIEHPELAEKFQAIRDTFLSPEDINDSPQTAPGKRIQKLIPDYEKPLYGTIAALGVGLETMRTECVLFDNWLKRLEALAKI